MKMLTGYVTPREAQMVLGLSKTRTLMLLDSGRLEGLRTPLGRLVEAQSLRAFAKKRETARRRAAEKKRDGVCS